ncbi:helix-turn-helix domain-containing protein [Bradyrhizobium japonicum]|uniref:helix-turn-helix domain-containing protein n=1 Tax=Bradyrhizobium japonicum TaxID=375 RepID=UPI0039089A43
MTEACFPPTAANDNERLLTLDEAATLLAICKRTLMRHVIAGELPCIVTGAGGERLQRKIHRADLRTFISKRRRVECPSIGRETSRRTTTVISRSEVIGFTAQRNARLSARRTSSNL